MACSSCKPICVLSCETHARWRAQILSVSYQSEYFQSQTFAPSVLGGPEITVIWSVSCVVWVGTTHGGRMCVWRCVWSRHVWWRCRFCWLCTAWYCCYSWHFNEYLLKKKTINKPINFSNYLGFILHACTYAHDDMNAPMNHVISLFNTNIIVFLWQRPRSQSPG